MSLQCSGPPRTCPGQFNAHKNRRGLPRPAPQARSCFACYQAAHRTNGKELCGAVAEPATERSSRSRTKPAEADRLKTVPSLPYQQSMPVAMRTKPLSVRPRALWAGRWHEERSNCIEHSLAAVDPAAAEAAWGCLPVRLACRLEPNTCANPKLNLTETDQGHRSCRLSRCRTELPGNAVPQRRNHSGVAFALYANDMTL
jgi:hypothetical protein